MAYIRILLTEIIFIISIYVRNDTYQSKTAKYSAMLLIKGSLSWWFWLGVVALGMVIPLAIASLSLFTETATQLLIIAIVLHTIGAVALKYVLLKAGVHTPLLPTLSYSHRL